MLIAADASVGADVSLAGASVLPEEDVVEDAAELVPDWALFAAAELEVESEEPSTGASVVLDAADDPVAELALDWALLELEPPEVTADT